MRGAGALHAERHREQAAVFDTGKPALNAAGHVYGDALTDAQRDALLEYLKTL